MRRFLLICIASLICAGHGFAQGGQAKINVDVTTGYERQDLKWSIAGNQSGQNPNIYSELQWKNVGGQTYGASAQWNFYKRVVLAGSFKRTSIRSGKVTDNDYNGDNRTNMVYNETFDADAGHNQDWSVSAGYTLIANDVITLTPFAGYNSSRQSLHLLDRSGNFGELNSTYEANWTGPFLKAIASLKLTNKLSLIGDANYTQANYDAKADWNLIQTFQHPVSYRHTAKGYGFEANAGVRYNIATHIAVKASAGYFTWHTGTGVDELYLSSGGSQQTQLNGVDRNGYRLNAGLAFSW